jgi:hypothetical protein
MALIARGLDRTIPVVARVKLIRERPDMEEDDIENGSLDDALRLLLKLGN